jgi:hypothetical protein
MAPLLLVAEMCTNYHELPIQINFYVLNHVCLESKQTGPKFLNIYEAFAFRRRIWISQSNLGRVYNFGYFHYFAYSLSMILELLEKEAL